jgi:DNA-binding ferritin-like protein
MIDKSLLGDALIELSDYASVSAGNMHTVHLNFVGREFDTMHKKVTKKYYEQLDDDYDYFAERARSYGKTAPNRNESSARIPLMSIHGQPVAYPEAVQFIDHCLTTLLEQYVQVFNILSSIDDCSIAIGTANFLQGRIQYWSDELTFFNKYRMEAAE